MIVFYVLPALIASCYSSVNRSRPNIAVCFDRTFESIETRSTSCVLSKLFSFCSTMNSCAQSLKITSPFVATITGTLTFSVTRVFGSLMCSSSYLSGGRAFKYKSLSDICLSFSSQRAFAFSSKLGFSLSIGNACIFSSRLFGR